MDKGCKKLERIFPDYFDRFDLPDGAGEEVIEVYRACKTGYCDAVSFTPSFEEKNFKYLEGEDPTDPGLYSLSTYEKPKDVKRFAKMNSDFKVPYMIAIGKTDPQYGVVQRTRERDGQNKKTSHVDWWLYVDAKPHEAFQIIPDFEQYLEEYNAGKADQKA